MKRGASWIPLRLLSRQGSWYVTVLLIGVSSLSLPS